jgi:hypothetical protein
VKSRLRAVGYIRPGTVKAGQNTWRPSKQKKAALGFYSHADPTSEFPFPIKTSSPVELRSNSVPSFTIEGKSIQSNLIFVDPRPLRHIMPAIVQDDQLVVSVPDLNGTLHDYTFPLQPNDLALKPIRSGCFDY